jgi:hypothetical protein
MQHTHLPSHEAAILTRIAGPEQPLLSSSAAKGILSLGFSDADKNRMHALIGNARAGTLTADETAEIEAYSRVNSLLGIMKSKARRALKRRGTNGKAKTH